MKKHELTWDQLNDEFDAETGMRHRVSLYKRYQLHLRFDVDPKEPSNWDDRFVLFMKLNKDTFQKVKTARDDQVLGDNYVDIVYDWCRPDAHYSLLFNPGNEGESFYMFEDVPFCELFNE